MTRAEVRSTLVVLVLIVVAVIALWPRSDASDDAASAAASSGFAGALPAPRPVDPAELAGARAAAALAPCPAPVAAGVPGPTVPALAGVALDCLGAPGTVDLSRALAGRTTLVNLWASWCGPCRAEIPALAAYAARPGAADLLGVAVADTPTASLSLLQALDAHYPSVSDPQQVVAARTGAVPVLPASVVVRPDGAVVPVPAEVFRSPDAVAAAVDRAMAAPVPAGSGG